MAEYKPDLSHLRSQFDDFKKEKKKGSGKKLSGKELFAKYFKPMNSRETFRILPVKPGKKFYQEAFFHTIPILDMDGKKKRKHIYCLSRNEPMIPVLDEDGKEIIQENGQKLMKPQPCPVCEKYKKILSKQDKSIKFKKKDDMNEKELKILEKNKKIFKDANVYAPRKWYIIKGIDRGAVKDGIKFWRFKDNYRGQGVMDKLQPVLEHYVETEQADFMSPVNGTDLILIVTESEWNGITYPEVSNISAKGKSKLHEDEHVAKQWINDTTTWRDVFTKKKAPEITPYEYLKMAVEGNEPANPYWDSNDKKWVFPGRPDLEEKANTRDRDLGGDDDENVEMASDLNDDGSQVTMSNVGEKNVGEFSDDAVDVGSEIKKEENKKEETKHTAAEEEVEDTTDDISNDESDYDGDDELDELPF